MSFNNSYRALSITGLLIATMASGTTRANIMTFGGNQYQLPEQADQLKLYFSLQIFILKFGTLIGQLVLPILKAEVECFEMDSCYPLSFGSASLAMMLGFIILLCGKSWFIQKPPTGNMLVNVSKCVMVINLFTD